MRDRCFVYFAGAIFVCSVFLCSNVLPMENSPIKVVSIKHKGQTIELKNGDSFVLVLLNSSGFFGYFFTEPENGFELETLGNIVESIFQQYGKYLAVPFNTAISFLKFWYLHSPIFSLSSSF